MYTTFLASMFRSIRFGIDEAHGKGIALQLNHFLDTGAVVVNPDGTFSVVPEKIRGSVTALTQQLMELQARGNRAEAEALLAKLGVLRPEVKNLLDKLTGVPVDIEPRYLTADQLTDEARTAAPPAGR